MDIHEHLLRALNAGPLQATGSGGESLQVRITLPTDENGYTERSCHAPDCEPKLFKVRGDMADSDRRCPYCGGLGDGNSFATEEQVRFAREKVTREAHQAVGDAVHQMVHDVLELDSRGRRKIGSGMFSMELSVKRERQALPEVLPPTYERPRRDVRCTSCGVDHVVFGLATWCHACGADIFGAHVATELHDVKVILQDAIMRRQELGERIFARLIENVVEDLVTAWEAGLRLLLQRHLRQEGKSRLESEAFLQSKIRNQLQNLDRSAVLLQEHMQVDVFKNVAASDLARASAMFAARHTITHWLGVTDPKYLKQTGQGHVGREVDLDPADLQWLAEFVETGLCATWSAAFPRLKPQSPSEGPTP